MSAELFLGQIFDRFPVALLVLLRITGLFILSPVFSKRGMPSIAKAGFALLLTGLVLPSLSAGTYYRFNSTVFALDCIKELLLGLVLGYVTTLFFSAAIAAGELIDNQIGFVMYNLFDTQSNIQMPLFGNLLNVLAMLLFLSIDGHLVLIRIICSSFNAVPPVRIAVRPPLGSMAAQFLTSVFILTVQTALPAIAASLMAEAGLAVMMRTIPQMNVFVVGMPLKIILGLVVIIVILPVYRSIMGNVFNNMYDAIGHFFEGFRAI